MFSAIASSDALCELAKGKTIAEAKRITNKEIINKLKGLPSIKVHCSVLGASGLKKAILDYELKQGKNVSKKEIQKIDKEANEVFSLMKVLFIQTGGTIDKDYPKTTKGYAFEIF